VQTSPDKPLVGFVTDMGGIDDGGYNQLAYEGLKRFAQERDIEFDVIETESEVGYSANLVQMIERGCAFIVALGGARGRAVERLAARYPGVHFILVDHEPLPDSKNVTGVIFAEDQAGFLAGALAGLMTERGTVGFVGGVPVAAVR
jgi:basic membrane protein A